MNAVTTNVTRANHEKLPQMGWTFAAIFLLVFPWVAFYVMSCYEINVHLATGHYVDLWRTASCIAIGCNLLGLVTFSIGRKVETFAVYMILAFLNGCCLFGYMVFSDFDPHAFEVGCASPPCGGPVGL